MKTLALATAALLSIGAGTAFAQTGEHLDYSPNVPAHTVPADAQSAASIYSGTETHAVQTDNRNTRLSWWESGFSSRRQLQNEIEADRAEWGNG